MGGQGHIPMWYLWIPFGYMGSMHTYYDIKDPFVMVFLFIY